MRRVEKRCAKCREKKLLIEFGATDGTSDGLFSWCKSCQRIYMIYGRQKVSQRLRTSKILQQLQQEKHEKKLQARRQLRLQRKYGITPQQYDSMMKEQGYLCALCGSELTNDVVPSIDHSHETDILRGIICRKCNLMLGLAEDDPKILYLGTKYLNQFR